MTGEVVETAVVEIEADTSKFEKQLSAIADDAEKIGALFGSSLSDAIKGGSDLEKIFRNLALNISGVFLNSGLAPLQEMISGRVSGIAEKLLTATATRSAGLAQFLGNVIPFAKGGVVNSPSLFPMAGGTGLAGEAGPEAILPLRRGADGQLGVAAGAGHGAPISIIMHVSTPDARSFQKSENQIATKLARAVGRGRRGL